jgi:hypothetical protein
MLVQAEPMLPLYSFIPVADWAGSHDSESSYLILS